MVDSEDISSLVERADEFLDNSRKGLALTVTLLLVGVLFHGAYTCLRNTREDVDLLLSVVQKLNDRSEIIYDTKNEMHNIYNDSQAKLDHLKNEINRAMSRMTNGLDRKDRFDFALEGAGGRIVSYHDSQLMYECGRISVLSGMCNEINPPSKAIQSSIEPGEGFCFKGNQGSLTIRLACNVAIDSVTIDHIQQSMAPIEYIAEAPKEFSLRALKELDDPHGVNIGKFTFDASHASQTFQIFGPLDEKFRYVQFNITGNHGSDEKTCIYRIRVHGFVDEC